MAGTLMFVIKFLMTRSDNYLPLIVYHLSMNILYPYSCLPMCNTQGRCVHSNAPLLSSTSDLPQATPACVLSSLLYGAETWTTYKSQERKLNQFHLGCLRKLLKVTWQDHVTNTQLLERTRSTSNMTILKRRLRWLGHLHRMDSRRIPKRHLCGELTDAPRRVGRP